MSRTKLPSLSGVAALILITSVFTPAAAQSDGSTAYELYTCANLWSARNNIYYSKGYCFKTARGKAAFPDNCFPPYGKLSASEQREVADIKRWESRKGCR